jgi:Flp pilus assembly pilin Flp
MRFLKKLYKDEGGQTTMEYVLIIGVIVAGALLAAWLFIPAFKSGVQELANAIKDALTKGAGNIKKTGDV